ncbi:CHAT domain-containing protein [uncultured Kordia sp.]|uniref:CHAT domain-containing protein n=1 Tax=uncultured Kordia sp. TaxID=507699 RepID=UPI00261AEA67|nr:CHAT domain-containing protein [uncultured Kordia sp.]
MSHYYKLRSIKNIIILCVFVFLIPKTTAQTVQNDTIFAKDLLQKVKVLAKEKKYTEANKVALQAATIFQKAKKWNLWYKAYNAIFYNGYYAKDYETSIDLIEKNISQLPKTELFVHGKIQFILGYLANALGSISDALTHYKLSQAYFKEANDYKQAAKILGNISLIYTQQGDYGNAQHYSKIAITYAKTDKDTLTIWKNTKALGDAYFYASEFEKAQKTFKKAQQIIDDKDGTFELIDAEILYELKAYEKALLVTKETIRLTSDCKKDVSKDTYTCQRNFNSAIELLGQIYLQLGQPDKALIQFQSCLGHIKSIGNQRRIGQLHIAIGDAYKQLKQFGKALNSYQKALHSFIPDFQEHDPLQNPSKDMWTLEIWLMDIFRNKGDCYFSKYQESGNDTWLQVAAENYEFAVNISETIRLNFSETKSKLILGSYTNEFYEELIKVKLALFERTKDQKFQREAFQISQHANAFVLRELVNEQQALRAANIPKDTFNLFQEYQKNIAILNRKVEDSIDFNASQKKLISTKEDFQNLKKAIAEKYPKFDKLRNDLEGILVTDLQKNIADHTVLIKYFLGAKTLYIFSITKQDFQVHQIELPENFQTTIFQYREALSDIDFINNTPDLAEQQYLQSAHSLYKTLLEKPLQSIKNGDFKELVIIPDGILHTIPFQALLIEKSDSWTTLENTVIKKYAIGYHYFCKMMQNPTATTSSKETFASFGLELDDYTLNYLQGLTQDSINSMTANVNLRGEALKKLTYSDDEALLLAELMHGNSWTNSAATKTNFIKHAKNVSGIHLATHSLINTKNPNFSSLIFTKTQDSISNLLRLDEIYNHTFNSNMITLSACNTGFGKYQKGEGLQSLARAFNFAKIPSVTATLWSIPDASSATIMKLYYTYLQEGHSKSIALQKAQIEYFENDEISSPASRLPFYWSAWTHIGANTTITFEQKSNFSNYLIAVLISLLVLGGWFWYKKSH